MRLDNDQSRKGCRGTPVLRRGVRSDGYFSDYSPMLTGSTTVDIKEKANGDGERKNIEFGVEGGVTLRGWLCRSRRQRSAPAITMAHGYAV